VKVAVAGGGSATWAVEAERLGVDVISASETWGADVFTPLAYLAAKTSRVKLQSSIAQAGTRTPAVLAMTAMSLAALSGDRFILGLGTSGPQVIEGWHGVTFKKAVTRLRETVEIIRLITSGERAQYAGEVYQLPLPGGEGRALRTSAEPRRIPIYLATLGPKSLEMTGEIADGWIASSFMAEHAGVFIERIKAGAERAGRSLDDIERQAGGVVEFSDDVDEIVRKRKPGFAFEIGAMGSPEHNFYKEAYARQGYAGLVGEVQRLWLERRRDEAAALIPDDFVLKANLLGTEAMVKDRIRAYRDNGITTLAAAPAGETMQERLDTLGRFLDLVRSVNEE
jgi:F420-dependent oxidoreductase-like protein